MVSDKKNISVRIDASTVVSMKAWKVLGTTHANILLEYDENDFLEYAVHRVITDESAKARFMLELVQPKSDKLINDDQKVTFKGTSLSIAPFDVPKTLRISNRTYAYLEDLLKESREKGISAVVKAVLAATVNNNKELVRFLIRNAIATRCMGTSLSFYSGKISPNDVKSYVVEGSVPRIKNTRFENDVIKEYVHFFKNIGTRERLQLEMLRSSTPPQNDKAYAAAYQRIIKIKEEDFAPYQRNDLFLPIVDLQHVGQQLVHLNEILHIFSTLDRLASNFLHSATIFPVMVAGFYNTQDGELLPNFLEVTIQLDKKYDDFREILNSEAESLLSLIT